MVSLQTPVCEFGTPAVDFALPGVDGRTWSLADCRGEKGLLVMFICNHCPYVKAVRERTGLTQEEFAATFAISLGALRHWERGDRKPRGTALVLLNVIARDPDAVLRAVEKA